MRVILVTSMGAVLEKGQTDFSGDQAEPQLPDGLREFKCAGYGLSQHCLYKEYLPQQAV